MFYENCNIFNFQYTRGVSPYEIRDIEVSIWRVHLFQLTVLLKRNLAFQKKKISPDTLVGETSSIPNKAIGRRRSRVGLQIVRVWSSLVLNDELLLDCLGLSND